MKIKGEYYDRLEAMVKSSPSWGSLQEYRFLGRSDKSWRWNCLWNVADKHARGALMNELYYTLDANDDHIDTALRKITSTK